MKVLITGGTGFLGKHLVKELASFCSVIYVLSRNENNEILEKYPNVQIIKGDITNLSIIEDQNQRDTLLEEVSIIIHAAGLYDIKASHAECYLQNVIGTQNILIFAKQVKNLKAFYHISTIAVGACKSYLLEEDQLPNREEFEDYYSETKYLAELIVRQTVNLKVVRIIRPGIIIGNSQNGEIDKLDGIYFFISAFKQKANLLKLIPLFPLSFNPKSKIAIIPVDHCARLISLLVKRDQFQKIHKTYHLISDQIPTTKEFLNDLNNFLGIKTQYIPVAQNRIHTLLFASLNIPTELVSFMFSKLSYDKKRTGEELPEIKESTYNTYKEILFKKNI